MNGYWKDKVVMITGASSGIGKEIARQVAKKGAITGLLARRESELKEVADKITGEGGEVRYFACDVSDLAAVNAAADELREEFGRIDVMIANAGIRGGTKAAQEADAEAVAKVIEINFIGAVNSVGAVLPKMLEHGSGHLVAISSLAAIRGLPKSAAYSGSKAGMSAYFESLRVDFQPRGVDVTIVQPGFIRTPLTAGRKRKLPFLLEVEEGASRIIRAIEKKKALYSFPWQLAIIVRTAGLFPSKLYDRITRRFSYREQNQ